MNQPNTRNAFVPLRAGMYELPPSLDGQPRLYAQRCTACHEVFASTSRAYCANCGQAALERILLGTEGHVHTYTVVHQKLPGSLIDPPYVIAAVALPEGVSVQSVLTDVDPAAVRVDMPVEICLRKVDQNEGGQPVVNFFFRPKGTS